VQQVFEQGPADIRGGQAKDTRMERNGASGRRTEIVASHMQFLGTSPAEGTEANPTDDPALPADCEIRF